MKILKNTPDRIITVLAPSKFDGMDDFFYGIVKEEVVNSKKEQEVCVIFSPSYNRTEDKEYYTCGNSSLSYNKKVSIEEEASSLKGTVLIMDLESSGSLLRNNLSKILKHI